MSYSNAIGRFDLNKVVVRKPLEYPDGSVQSKAFYGNRIDFSDEIETTILTPPILVGFDTISVEDNKVYSYSGYLTIVNDATQKTNCLFQIEQEADGVANLLSSYGPITFASNQTINIPINSIQSSGITGGTTSLNLRMTATGGGSATITYYRMEVFKLCDFS